MAWFAELAGKAENLLQNLDEQTGAAIRNHNVMKQNKYDRSEYSSHPESTWGQKKRTTRTLKKNPVENRNYAPTRKSSPIPTLPHARDSLDYNKNTTKGRKPQKKIYSLERAPRTLVGDIQDINTEQYGHKERRYSLPTYLDGISNESLNYRMENLEVENEMLKNELNVINREVAGLLERLHKTEDGETVVSSNQDLSQTRTTLENTEEQNKKVKGDNKSLLSQIDELKIEMNNLCFSEIKKYKDKIEGLGSELTCLKDKNTNLEEIIEQLNQKSTEKDSSHIRLDTELRHAQSTIKNLQSDLDKVKDECSRLEKDWETYKHRVKSMLNAKDKEIKALQEGLNLSEDTKILVEQIENLRQERDVLSETMGRVRGECESVRQYVGTLEARHAAAERVVCALRDALRDERASRNRAEAQCSVLTKELKSIQIESGQTIASLRTALRDKDSELNRTRESYSSIIQTTDTSALNVADFDVSKDSVEDEKVHHLSQKLVQRQGRIDSLLADNNMLRIQLEKLESKYKTELQMNRSKAHSVVHVQDGERQRSRSNHQPHDSALIKLSRRMDVLIRRNPIFRIFVIIYMLGLHFWVLTVLLTSTPDNYIARTTKL